MGPASILFNISPVTGLNCRAETQPQICILIGPYYGNVVATLRPGLPATMSTAGCLVASRRDDQPLDETRRAGPRPCKAKSGFGRIPLRFVAPLIASRRIIEPIHSREYAHLIDSHCCRSFIASATNSVRHSETLLPMPPSCVPCYTPSSFLHIATLDGHDSFLAIACMRFSFVPQDFHWSTLFRILFFSVYCWIRRYSELETFSSEEA